MWTLAVAVALGAPEPEDEALEDLPWRIADAERWDVVDRRSTRVARAGAWTAGIGGAATLVGSSLVLWGDANDDEGTTASGALLAVLGTMTAITGPPIALGGATRARRALRHRGVVVSSSASIVGWSLYGTGLFMIPTLVAAGVAEEEEGFFVLGTAWYASLVVLPLGQVDVNRRGREAAGLAPVSTGRAVSVGLVPARNGVALAGTF